MTQVENSLLESGMELRDSKRSSKKPWVICSTVAISSLIILVIYGIMCYIHHIKTTENCWTQAILDTKTQAADLLKAKDWKWSFTSNACMRETDNQKLEIIQNGTYLIYGQIMRITKTKAHFAIQLQKGNDILSQSQSNEDIIVFLGIYHLKESEKISLVLNENSFEHIEKNPTQTYWGILHVAP